jgi:Mg2+ and Co2+ transporter CorA
VLLRLDTSQNQLLIANTAITVLGCAIAFAAYITGAFGMNLDNVDSIQPVKFSFTVVFVLSFAGSVLLFLIIYGYLRQSGILPSFMSTNTLPLSNSHKYNNTITSRKSI